MKILIADTVTVESFKTTLIISEIVITALVLYGFYLIFSGFVKKNKDFKDKMKKDS